MADITWSAYALAMFTPEERAAAVAATIVPEDTSRPLPPGTPIPPVQATIGVNALSPVPGLDPNTADGIAKLWALGWRYEGGVWIAAGSPGVVATPDEVARSNGGRAPGLSSVTSASTFATGSVLGVQVPAAPPALLPSWVGGAVGHVVRSGGTRPESGGVLRIIKGEGHKYSWTRVVR